MALGVCCPAMATAPTPRRKRTAKRAQAPAPPPADPRIEPILHAACVRAGAAAALQVALDRLPMLKPFLPRAITHHARGDAPERIQRLLVKEIYARYEVRPAAWELEGILAVAASQSVLTPLASQAGLASMMRAWMPEQLSNPIIRYTPLEPLVTATARAVAATWAAGRYADSVWRRLAAGTAVAGAQPGPGQTAQVERRGAQPGTAAAAPGDFVGAAPGRRGDTAAGAAA